MSEECVDQCDRSVRHESNLQNLEIRRMERAREEAGMYCDDEEIARANGIQMELCIRALKNRARVDHDPLVYLAVSPAGCRSSTIDIVGAYFDGLRMIIILLDSAPIKFAALTQDRIGLAILEIRRVRPRAKIMCLLESDYERHITHDFQYFLPFGNVHTLMQCAGGRPGVPVLSSRIPATQRCFRERITSSNIFFSECLASITSDSEEIVDTLIELLSTYKWTGSSNGVEYSLVETIMMISYWDERRSEDQ